MSENGRLKDSELAPTLLGGRLTKEAADAADRMFTKFGLDGMGVLQAVSAADTYRTYEQQVEARERVGNLAAIPGTSNHGWGLAVDYKNGMNAWSSSTQEWFERNGDDFGWFTPGWANPDSEDYQKNEPWHKEYRRSLDKRRGPKIRRPESGEIGIGSEGQKVTRIQVLLNQRLSGPNLVVDGKFGLASAVAAARYQRDAGLSVSGVIGSVTMNALETGYAPGDMPIYLQKGTKKADQVEVLQAWLKKVFPKQYGNLVVDGDFGDHTESAVKHWQTKADMAPTGKIGPASRNRLLELGVRL